MHGSIREELENVLAAKPSAAASLAVNHLAGCEECALEVASMRAQSAMLKTLQTREMLEPSAGFYARVLQRIEETAARSIWWVFVYSPVGKRLAYASLAVTLALGGYVVAAETNDGDLALEHRVVAMNQAVDHYDLPVVGTADQQRAAVLANFVSHPAPSE